MVKQSSPGATLSAGPVTIGVTTAQLQAVAGNTNLFGKWAVVDREFASYIPVLGVGALNAPGFAGYSSNFLNRLPTPGSAPTENIRTTLSTALAVDTTINTLAVNTNTPAVAGVPVPTLIDLGGKGSAQRGFFLNEQIE